MSVIQRFHDLDGQTVTREYLMQLQNEAFKLGETNPDAVPVWARIKKLLETYPKATEFELELVEPIEQITGLGKLDVITKGDQLQYFHDKIKVATINQYGTITYHKKRLPAGAKKEIRKAADIIGLACPCDESMLHGIDFLENDDEHEQGLGKPVSPNDIYDYITNLILNTIKQVGHLPWQKEWIGSGSNGEAKNYVSKKPYTGANFLLNFEVKYDKEGQGYLVPIKFKQPYYLTFNQVKEAKATIKKDSKARRVIYYTMVFDFTKPGLEFKTSDKAKFAEFVKTNKISAADLKEFLIRIPVIKYYNVYRADDCTGLKFDTPKPVKNATPIQQAQAIIDGYKNPPKYTFVGSDAYYMPAKDTVNMPKISAFTKEAYYYSTFFHEIVHSTGSEKRLNRFNNGASTKKDYAFEELIAELGAVFLCSEAGILFTTVENSAKYLKGWNSRLITELENDNRFFLKASAKAQKAADLILDRNQEKDQVTPAAKNKKVVPVKAAIKKPIVKKATTTVTKVSKTVTKKAVSVPKGSKPKSISTVNKAIDQKKYPLSIVRNELPIGTVVRFKKQYMSGDKEKSTAKIIFHAYDNMVRVAQYPFRVKVKYNDGSTDWVKPWTFDIVSEKPTTNGKKTMLKTKPVSPKGFTAKPKSTSVKTAIADVLSLPKFKGLTPFEASVVYNLFREMDPLNTETEIHAKNDFQKQVLANESLLQYYSDYGDTTTLSGLGVEFVTAVKGRLESLVNSKHNYAIFDGLKNPVEVPVFVNTAAKPQSSILAPELEERLLKPLVPVPSNNKLMQMQFESLPMDQGWEKLMQHPAANMKIAIWGAPKNGKTAGALQLANYLTKFGNVLYNFADQGFNKSTQDLWISSGLANNSKAEPSDISSSAELEKEIKTGKYKFVFIDMISDYIRTEKLTPEGFKERFIKQFPNVSFILIFEVTKGGNFKGDQGWTHLVDAIMTVEDFLMENRGRYGSGEFVVWQEGFARYNPKRYAQWLEENTEETHAEEIQITEDIEKI